MTTDQPLELGALWDRVKAQRRVIFWIVAISTVVIGTLVWFLPPWYRAEASLLPPSEEASFGLGNLLKGIGVPGVKVPTQAAPADVFLAILESRTINEEIVNHFDLRRRYRKKLMVDAIKELKRHANFQVDDVGIIKIAVEDRDPQRAADMANAYFETLDRFNREVRMTKGKRTREFIGKRLLDTENELATAEQKLADYEATHKAVALTPEMSSAIETASRYYAERSALQIRLGVIRSYSRGTTDEERQVLQQLEQVDHQLAALPGTGLTLARLIRDVKTQEELYILLTAQYEDARITEARDVSTVEQLDAATPPEKKSRPRRGVITVGAFFFSLVAGMTYALFRRVDGPEADRAP